MITKLVLFLFVLGSFLLSAEPIPKSCVVNARAYQVLHAANVWTRLVRFVYQDSYPSGHVVCVYALANDDLWVYDHNNGSRPLGIKSHDISEIGKALGNIYRGIATTAFIDE